MLPVTANGANGFEEAIMDRERARLQREKLLKFGLFLMFLMIFLDGGVPRRGSPYGPYASGGPAAPSELLPTPEQAAQFTARLKAVVGSTRSSQLYPRNVTGIFQGDWNVLKKDAGSSSSSSSVGTAAPWNGRNAGRFLLQLRSVPLAAVPELDFVYGVVKMYKSSSAETGYLFPVQGVFLATTGQITLLSTAVVTERMYLEVPVAAGPGVRGSSGSSGGGSSGSGSNVAGSTERHNSSSSSSSSSNNNSNSNSKQRKRRKWNRAMLSTPGGSNDFVTVALSPRVKVSAAVGSTGMRVHIVDTVLTESPPPTSGSGSNGTTTQLAPPPLVVDPSTMVAIGEALLPSSFKSLQRSMSPGGGATAAGGTGSSSSIPVGGIAGGTQPAGSTSSCLFALQMQQPTVPTTTSNSNSKNNATALDQDAILYATSLLGDLASPTCGLVFNMSAMSLRPQLMAVERKADTYSLLVSFICVAQISLLLMQLRMSNTQAGAAKVSIMCVCGQAMLDAALCIAHLILSAALPNTFFGHFMWIAILKLVLFGVFEMRTVVTVYQARFSHEISSEGWDGLRRRLAAVHLRFYAALFVAVFVSLYSRSFPVVLVFLFYSFWVPQIVYNVTAGSRKAFHPLYVAGMTITRLFVPLYIFGCPKNFLLVLFDRSHGIVAASATESAPAAAAAASMVPYSLLSCVVLLVWMGLQVGVLFSQDLWGPRWFVPQSLFPRAYDYGRPVPSHLLRRGQDASSPPSPPAPAATGGGWSRLSTDDPSSSTSSINAPPAAADDAAPDVESGGLCECVICYNAVEVEPGRYMITPCDHLFHKACLSQWLAVKMECPVCRSALPELDET
jgi:hypothetical protein